ncbi:hypothetical protein [Methylobacter marinus]|uniref:hypothetical protein n=1 Tax=Methylobacter marinus TaxID=34058 RepID=UPI000369A3D0|nr:hypothetical protein [Methylobacter marinus]
MNVSKMMRDHCQHIREGAYGHIEQVKNINLPRVGNLELWTSRRHFYSLGQALVDRAFDLEFHSYRHGGCNGWLRDKGRGSVDHDDLVQIEGHMPKKAKLSRHEPLIEFTLELDEMGGIAKSTHGQL